MRVKYPDVTVQLTGKNGNVYNLLGIVAGGMRKSGLSIKDKEDFIEEATSSGSYDEVIQLIMRTVNVI